MEKRAENVQKLIDGLHGNIDILLNEFLNQCESPIEELMCIGLMSELGIINANTEQQKLDADLFFDIQHEIDFDSGKKSRVDFILTSYDGIISNGIPIYDWETQLIVECDGWEFHSTKEQISSDNERDAKILGERIIPTIRFLGKDINQNPFKCARTAIEVLRELAKEKRNEVEFIIESTLDWENKQRVESIKKRSANE